MSPPATRDSLFASATRLPASSAASVGASPIEPVIALSTTSQESAAISVEAPGPSMTSTPGRAARISSAFLITPTTLTLNFFAWLITTSGCEPAEVIARTEKRSGLAATISRA